MRHSAVTTVAATWLRLVEGTQGWTGLPRLVVWLCVPAFIAGAAAVASQISGAIASPTNATARAMAISADAITMLFGSAGMLTTPVAALLVLVLSLLKRWRFRVVCWLWAVVFLALGTTFPAVATAIRSWMVLQGVHQGH